MFDQLSYGFNFGFVLFSFNVGLTTLVCWVLLARSRGKTRVNGQKLLMSVLLAGFAIKASILLVGVYIATCFLSLNALGVALGSCCALVASAACLALREWWKRV